MFRSSAAVFAALVALAGCSGAKPAAVPAHVAAATPNLPCTLPYGTQVTLLAPRTAAGKVAAGSTTVVLAASRDLPKTATIVATDAKGNKTSEATLERSVRSRRHTRVPFADPVFYRARGLALHAHGDYTIALDDLAQNGCAPYVALNGNTRFST